MKDLCGERPLALEAHSLVRRSHGLSSVSSRVGHRRLSFSLTNDNLSFTTEIHEKECRWRIKKFFCCVVNPTIVRNLIGK